MTGITWKTAGATAQKLGEALEKPLWGAEIDAAVGEALTYLPLLPVREPRADILLDAPRLLREIDASQAPPGEQSKSQSGMPIKEWVYLHNWAAAAGYIESGAGAQGAERERLSHEGRRLADIPEQEKGSVRAALGAGRGMAAATDDSEEAESDA